MFKKLTTTASTALYWSALSALLLCISGCGESLDVTPLHSLTAPILNGTVAVDGDYPAVGAILVSATIEVGNRQGVSSSSSCTGILIEPDVVLTAAHCIDEELFSRLVRREFGEDALISELKYYFTLTTNVSSFNAVGEPLELPEKTYFASHVIPHPDFSLDSFVRSPFGLGENDDIGLMYLAAIVEEVEPSILMRPEDAYALIDGASVGIVGYGQSSLDEALSVGVKYFANTMINEVGDFEMQIGRESPVPQKCRGDSGGPTMMYFDDGLYPANRVVGITSHAYSRQECAVGGVDTRVDIYWAWLDATMSAGCINEMRIGCPRGDRTSTPAQEPLDRFDGYERASAADAAPAKLTENFPEDSGVTGLGCAAAPFSGCWGLVLLAGWFVQCRRSLW